MTKQQLWLEKAKEIVDIIGRDTEAVHVELDDLLCDVLVSEGYEDLVEFFKSIGKWYA